MKFSINELEHEIERSRIYYLQEIIHEIPQKSVYKTSEKRLKQSDSVQKPKVDSFKLFDQIKVK